MDVIYPYKRHRDGFELRYSLRSLRNVAHGKVFVSGDAPPWRSDALTHIKVSPDANRYRSSTANILAAAQASCADRVMVMHDDIFVLRPLDYRHENRGSIEEYLKFGGCGGEYRKHVISTRDILVGHGISDPLWFGLHTPTIYDRKRLIDVIGAFSDRPCLLRTIYHNLHSAPSDRRDDVKVYSWKGSPPADDFLSVSDMCAIMPPFRTWLSGRFPDPSIYERSP